LHRWITAYCETLRPALFIDAYNFGDKKKFNNWKELASLYNESNRGEGSVTLENGVHYPVIISLQPPNQSTNPSIVRQRIDAILATFKIMRNGIRGQGKPDLSYTDIG
jgi:hypothetical protein